MASYFSNNFAAIGANTTLLRGQTNNVGDTHGRLRYKRMEIEFTGAFALNEVARMGQFRSSDRLVNLYLTTDDLGTVGSLDVGLWLSTPNHDGAVLDADCFATIVSVTSAVARTDILLESTTFAIEYRGKYLWQYLPSSYSVDPVVNFDIGILAHAATDAAGTVLLEAIYTAGD